MALYRVPPLAHYLPDRTVVLVDDGLATGLTMRAAVAYARRHGARGIIVAVPCAAPEANAYFERVADRVVSLIVDPGFMAVGAYYVDFSPVTDEAVVSMLARAQKPPTAQDASGSNLRISFVTARGFRLAGQLVLPATPGPYPVVAFAHGWGSGKDSPRNGAVAAALQARGVASLLFDFTGHGESEGTADQSTLEQQVSDLRAAIDLLETLDDVDARRIGVAGASSGAAVALTLAARDPRVRTLALRSGNFEGAETVAPGVTVPTLLMVGEHDEAIRTMNEAVAAQLGGERRIDVIPGGDHLFDRPEALRQATTRMVEWLAGKLG
jgi:dienelactone hydrolase